MLNLRFKLGPNGKEITAIARVVRQDSTQEGLKYLGVHFIQISTEDKAEIAKYIQVKEANNKE